jgi:hydrogenase maturation protease
MPTSASSPAKTVIIGYGSPIRGDDAIGPLVADRLMDQVESSSVAVHSLHILTAELIEELAEAELVLFLDASTDGPVGQVCCRPLEPVTEAASSMAHFLSPGELLGWLQVLYGRRPEAYLLSVRGVSFDFANFQLSATSAAAVEPMIECVQEILERSASLR